MAEEWLIEADLIRASEDPSFRDWLSEYNQLESAYDGNCPSRARNNSIPTRLDVTMELTDRQRDTLSEMAKRWQFNDPTMHAFGEGKHYFKPDELLEHAGKLCNRPDEHDARAAADIIAQFNRYQFGS
jgi:hypothetical protein